MKYEITCTPQMIGRGDKLEHSISGVNLTSVLTPSTGKQIRRVINLSKYEDAELGTLHEVPSNDPGFPRVVVEVSTDGITRTTLPVWYTDNEEPPASYILHA